MRILGIDCGTERTGYGIIETGGPRHTVLNFGVIRTQAADPMAERLVRIAAATKRLMQDYQPDSAAVETVFHGVNVRTVIQLAQVRGAVLLTLASEGIAIAEYSPLEVKSSVVGYGRADKTQVQKMVVAILGLMAVPPQDAADALALAICHAHRAGSLPPRRTA